MFSCKLKFKYFASFSVTFFFSKYLYDYYRKIKLNYYCPLGEDKFSVDELKFKEDNLKLLKIIELENKEDLGAKTKIAEDDEYNSD
jgi:hypothetical protein